jgi:hypothetical protein
MEILQLELRWVLLMENLWLQLMWVSLMRLTRIKTRPLCPSLSSRNDSKPPIENLLLKLRWVS